MKKFLIVAFVLCGIATGVQATENWVKDSSALDKIKEICRTQINAGDNACNMLSCEKVDSADALLTLVSAMKNCHKVVLENKLSYEPKTKKDPKVEEEEKDENVEEKTEDKAYENPGTEQSEAEDEPGEKDKGAKQIADKEDVADDSKIEDEPEVKEQAENPEENPEGDKQNPEKPADGKSEDEAKNTSLSDNDKEALADAVGWNEYLNRNDGYDYAIGYSLYAASEKAAKSEAYINASRQVNDLYAYGLVEEMEYRTFFRKNSSGKLRYFTACVVRNKKKKLSSSTESNWESETIEKLKKTKSYEKYKDGGNLVFGIGEEKSNINDARVSCVSDARQKCKSKYKKFSFFAWEKEYGESKNTGYYTCIVLAECVPTD